MQALSGAIIDLPPAATSRPSASVYLSAPSPPFSTPPHSLSHYRPSTLSSSGSRGYFSRPLASSASSAPSSPSPSSPQEISGISRRTKKLPYHDVRCCTCQQPIPPTASLLPARCVYQRMTQKRDHGIHSVHPVVCSNDLLNIP